jgi:ParB/RepB/Spo0J family partition protein
MYQYHLIEIDLGRIKVNPLNPRKHQGEAFDQLKASIQEMGIIVPPLVRVLPAGFYEIIDGEGRAYAAKELGLEKIVVFSIGIADDELALSMLQASNTVRTFSFLAECRGLANLHRKGQTPTKLAKETGKGEEVLSRMIAIGYFPEAILNQIETAIARSEEHAAIWTLSLLQEVLPLRELLPGATDPKIGTWHSLDGVYAYHEVNTAIGLTAKGHISTTREMRAYVSNRRYEIYQTRFNQEVQKRVQEELELAKQELAQAHAKKQECLEQEISARYTAQVQVLQDQYDDLNRRHKAAIADVARHPEEEKQRIAEHERRVAAEIEKTRAERLRLQAEQEAIAQQRKKELQLQETLRRSLEIEAQNKLAVNLAEQESKHHEAEKELKAFYEQKSLSSQLKAETTIRGLISHVIRLLTESQQALDHAVSPAMIQAVHDLGGAQHESFLWAIRSLAEALDRAENKLTYGDRDGKVIDGGESFNGHQPEQDKRY